MQYVITESPPKVKIHWRLRRRLDQAYDNAYWGYVCAREQRHEPDMLWWGTHVVRIRLLRSGQSEEKVTVQLVEALEQELRDRGANIQELVDAPEQESQDAESDTTTVVEAAEQELQDAGSDMTTVVEAPEHELQDAGSDTTTVIEAPERELQDAGPDTTTVVEAPEQGQLHAGPIKANGAGALQRKLVQRQPELSES